MPKNATPMMSYWVFAWRATLESLVHGIGSLGKSIRTELQALVAGWREKAHSLFSRHPGLKLNLFLRTLDHETSSG